MIATVLKDQRVEASHRAPCRIARDRTPQSRFSWAKGTSKVSPTLCESRRPADWDS